MKLHAVLLAGLCLAACSPDESGSAGHVAPEGTPRQGETEPPYGLSPWLADFPFPVEVSPSAKGVQHHLTRRQALERLVAKLQGNCTRNGWLFAKDFVDRAPEEVIPKLIESLEKSHQVRQLADWAENLVDALGRLGRFDDERVRDSLVEALEHSKPVIVNKAMRALRWVGDRNSIVKAQALMPRMEVRARADWVRCAAAHMGTEADPIFAQMLSDDRFRDIFGIVVTETLQLPVERAAKILGPLWLTARDEFRLQIAGVLHGVGDVRGSQFLRKVLRGDQSPAIATAIRLASRGKAELLFEDVMRHAASPVPAVRLAMIEVLSGIEGENAVNLLTTFAEDIEDSVRHSALRVLSRRGVRDPLDRRVHEVRTATGTKLLYAMADLAAAQDEVAMPVIAERYGKAARTERWMFIQALGHSRTRAGFGALREIFLADEVKIDTKGKRTSHSYVGVLLPNILVSRHDMVKLYRELDKSDYRRRAFVLHSLGNIAGLSEDREFVAAYHAALREIIFASDELPQLRLLALNFFQRGITLADMRKLQDLQDTEKPPMRAAIQDYLHEFF